ncbi:MAG: hypothetical protein NWP69_06140 [Congregibacter sp.]|nr:hypothetical protein [Congregibacter sp.]MDP5072111.1 hypothetical protein [Congregibacter sp.]
MILSRLVRSFRSHDWFTAAVEFVLLIAGIFIGFQIDRWSDQRLDQQRADEYRQQLISDLSIEKIDVENVISYHEQVLTFSMTALSAWSDNPAADAEALIVAFYQASNTLPFTAARGAYDALSDSGLIDLLGGPALTSRLSAYYGAGINDIFAEEKRYRLELRGVMPVAVQQRIRNDCIRIAIKETIIETLDKDCALGLSADEAQQILGDILKYPKMQFYLRQAISRDSIFILLFGSRGEFIESLLTELRAL